MPTAIDPTGNRFGRLFVTGPAPVNPEHPNRTLWLCDCDCGSKAVLVSYRQLRGHKTSCGCKQAERARGERCALCESPQHVNPLCHNHHEQWRRWGKPPQAEWIAAFRQERLLACVVCTKPFNGYPTRKFCSLKCKTEFKRKAALEHWHRRAPESKQLAVQRSNQLSRKRRADKKIERPCHNCGKPYLAFAKQKFCCKACRHDHRYLYSRQYRRKRKLQNLASAPQKLSELLVNPSEQPKRICRICGKRKVARGLCKNHWTQWSHQGRLDVEDFIFRNQTREAANPITSV